LHARKKLPHAVIILETTPSGEIVSKTTPDGEICLHELKSKVSKTGFNH